MNSWLREYAVNTKRFLNLLSNEPLLTPLVAPGMAVNMYYSDIRSKNGSPSNSVYLHTSDLDITVFMKRKVSVVVLRQLIARVFEKYDAACQDFVAYYTERTGEKATLIKKCLKTNPNECMIDITRKQGAPFFDRHIYAVKQYFVKTKGETHELMDVVIAYQEPVPKRHIAMDRRMSFATGFQVPQKGYLIKELWKMIQVDVLGTSPFNKKRHPVTGKEHQKGLKDLYRLRYMLTRTSDRRYDKYRVSTKHILNILKKTTYSSEKKVMRIKDVLLRYISHETPTHS
jgi:hypothetical protein